MGAPPRRPRPPRPPRLTATTPPPPSSESYCHVRDILPNTGAGLPSAGSPSESEGDFFVFFLFGGDVDPRHLFGRSFFKSGFNKPWYTDPSLVFGGPMRVAASHLLRVYNRPCFTIWPIKEPTISPGRCSPCCCVNYRRVKEKKSVDYRMYHFRRGWCLLVELEWKPVTTVDTSPVSCFA